MIYNKQQIELKYTSERENRYTVERVTADGDSIDNKQLKTKGKLRFKGGPVVQ